MSANRLADALECLLEMVPEPPPSNCACHISPPCGDCNDFAGLREAFAYARKALAEHRAEVKP